METRIIKCDPDNFIPEVIESAASAIKAGGLVAFPTETVYGLGGDGLLSSASKKIYAAKGRPSDNPLILHIADKDSVYALALEVPEKAVKLMDEFWPGPLTLVFKKRDIVPYETTGGLDTVAIRMPSHPAALELIRQSGCPIAAPSANVSGRPSPSKASHVADDLSGRIDYIIDGGETDIGIESTIVDMTGDIPMILRPGYITLSMLKEVVGDVDIDPAVKGDDIKARPKAPGMKYTHYAPKGEMTIVEGEGKKVSQRINELVMEKQSEGFKCGVLASAEMYESYEADVVLKVGSRLEPVTISAGLYSVLREFDDLGVQYIFSESFSGEGLGNAIMNRLLKAAGHRVIEV
ncbi:MAG: threonylcarbamoyl-AMP synthase [Lachnospiraceae bacterium]|nr:threonylcarbamoyl-AMP synthase [Lachnospiraceae bacterium]